MIRAAARSMIVLPQQAGRQGGDGVGFLGGCVGQVQLGTSQLEVLLERDGRNHPFTPAHGSTARIPPVWVC